MDTSFLSTMDTLQVSQIHKPVTSVRFLQPYDASSVLTLGQASNLWHRLFHQISYRLSYFASIWIAKET